MEDREEPFQDLSTMNTIAAKSRPSPKQQQQQDYDTDDEPEQEGQGVSTSPTTSVSVSSVAPTIVSALLEQHQAKGSGARFPFELTPVMRNTSNDASNNSSTTTAAPSGQQTQAQSQQHRSALQHYTNHPGGGHAAIVSPPNPSEAVAARRSRSLDYDDDDKVDEEGGVRLLHMKEGTDPSTKEHLSLPSNLVTSLGATAGMPPLRVTAGSRSQSLTLSQQQPHRHSSSSSSSSIHVPAIEGSAAGHTSETTLRPVPFPNRQKFFSFSNREQYEDHATTTTTAVAMENGGGDMSEGNYYEYGGSLSGDGQEAIRLHPQHCLRPYQPARPEDAMLEVPPEEELNQIFAARRQFSETRAASLDSAESSKQHRLLYASTATVGSDGGIPSLHLAHRLSTTTDNASITTHTTLNTLGMEDEDEDFLNFSGHPSWSSFHNSNSHHEPLVEDVEAEAAVSPNHRRQASETPSVIVEGLLDHDHPEHGLLLPQALSSSSSFAPQVPQQSQQLPVSQVPRDDERDDTDNDTTMAVNGRHQKEREALEWLQALQLDHEHATIAEAASSKFLCGATSSSSPRGPSPAHSPARRNTLPVLRPASPVLP